MKDVITRAFNAAVFQVKEHSGEILAVAGVGLGVTAAVLACKNTMKAHEILEKGKQNLEDIHEAEKIAKEQGLEDYKEDSVKKDLAVAYGIMAKDLLVCYGPAIILGGLSIGCIFTSTNIMRKRNLTLAAAYGTLDSIHKDYRARVKEKYGEQVDQEMRYGIKAKEIKSMVQKEDGSTEEKKETKNVATKKINKDNDFTRIFDRVNSVYWRNNAYYNKDFIQGVETDMNILLKKRGYVFLNDVYEALGMDGTEAGHDIGWVYKDHTEKEVREHHNCITITPITYLGDDATDFNNGYEPSCILDFNVDGYIRNQITWAKR